MFVIFENVEYNTNCEMLLARRCIIVKGRVDVFE